jgi:3-hydroxybutyryl-CoA dehydrogenase
LLLLSIAMEIKTVGLVGLGLLGRGIAASLLGHDLRVIAYSRDPHLRPLAREHIQQALDEMEQHGEAHAGDRWQERYIEAESLEELCGADAIIESVTEELETKREVFAALEDVVGSEVPIYSNTSAIPISVMQQELRHPQRFVGMHWGEPCHILRFMEIIRGEKTSDAAFESARVLAERLGKEPSLVQKDVRGFITNRLFYAMLREALYLLESGVADAETIDRSFRNDMGWWATLAGPFRFMDLSGGAPAYALVAKDLFPQLCIEAKLPDSMRILAENGATGVANGRGFFEYSDAEAKAWERQWHDFTWDVKSLADKYLPLDEEEPKKL